MVSIPLMFALSVVLKGAQNPDSLTIQRVNLALMASVVQLVLIIVAAVVFVVSVSGADSWWFGTGFYGSVIGVSMMIIFLRMVKQQYPTSQSPQVFTQYGLPSPMYTQPGVPPYAAPQTSAAPQMQGRIIPAAGTAPGQLPATKFCSQCGQPLAAGVRFCDKCGARIQ